MQKFHLYLFTGVITLAFFASPFFGANNGLLIPMPGQKQIEKQTMEKEKKEKEKQQKQLRPGKAQNNGTLIPLPGKISRPPKPTGPDKLPDGNEQRSPQGQSPLIIIRPTPVEDHDEQAEQDFPEIPGEVVIESEYTSLTPTVDLPSSNQAPQTPAGDLPLFPKDTSSAVFMVMKTWQASGYDGNTLLAHAVNVYSEEAGEQFQIKGLTEANSFKLDLDEEDITLDELLDLIALKTGRDWGVDIPSKTIYFYPPGVDTGSLSAW
jgi:hypothetical protein